MKIKSERDFWSGVAFVAAGSAFAIGASGYAMGPACEAGDPCAASLRSRLAQISMHPGPGLFPLGLSIVLIALGVVVVFKSLTIESPGGDRIGTVAWRPLIVLVAAIAAFGLAIEPLGALPSVAAFVVAANFAVARPPWRVVVVMAVVLGSASWLLLERMSGASVPLLPQFLR